jgi:hypothetical protein
VAFPIEEKLVVAVASSVLFDLRESDEVFTDAHLCLREPNVEVVSESKELAPGWHRRVACRGIDERRMRPQIGLAR